MLLTAAFTINRHDCIDLPVRSSHDLWQIQFLNLEIFKLCVINFDSSKYFCCLHKCPIL